MKKKLSTYLCSFTLLLVAVFSCCLLSACGGTPPVNNRIGYDGTYKFAELKIYRATEYAGSYLPYEGDEDADKIRGAWRRAFLRKYCKTKRMEYHEK